MNIKTKMLMSSVLLAAVPVVLASLAISYLTYQESHKTMQTAVKNQLTAIGEATKDHIEGQFSIYRNQVITYSDNSMIRNAMRKFRQAYKDFPEEIKFDRSKQLPQLKEYYNNAYSSAYRDKNGGAQVNTSSLYNSLSDAAIALQHTYIKNNPNPIGAKSQMIDVPEAGFNYYVQLHNRYHEAIRNFSEKFDYYDIFLVEPDNGNVVYSVAKEIDFGTSLKTGPHSNTGLARAYEKAMGSDDASFSHLETFSPYAASYDDAASFIASPIYDGDKKIGVLIFQMPVDQINNVMMHDQSWEERGLGKTGETYLVGDGVMLSKSRFLVEDKEGYYAALKAHGVSAGSIEKIEAKNTTIGLQPINNKGTQAALSGSAGFDIITNYFGDTVVSAYAPLKIGDVNWAIMSEINEGEAYASVEQLQSVIRYTTIAVVLIVLAIAVIIGKLISGNMVKPILSLSNTLRAIEKDTDLTHRAQVHAEDEMGMAGKALNSMMDNFSEIVHSLSSAVDQVALAAHESAQATSESNNNMAQGKDEVELLTSAMADMSVTIQEINSHTSQATEYASETRNATSECQQRMEKSVQSLNNLSEGVNSGAEVIKQLEVNSNNITTVLDVIRSVAEQTNLLALNAAIEAARAGEQGRGFAVVADEVRTLAQRTQESTEEIQKLVETFQANAADAVKTMTRSQEEVVATVELANETNESLQGIVEFSEKINDSTITVATATEKQFATASEIENNVARVNEMFNKTSSVMMQTASANYQLENIAQDLQQVSNRFKTH